MPSFDIVSKVDAQALDNAVNVVHKEVTNRFDFKDSPVVIDLNKKDFKLNDLTKSEVATVVVHILISLAFWIIYKFDL